ncbi:Cytochrome c oxidase subunit 2 [Anaerohalosphaera lusitana]|uniref:Cytochrome c oxidase subunit 2 n=1 Tax=Anaerohalosphaera lusitana TaxID=1936003 RepID=A0A1U9NP25_9BACT|nr:cupredoxin domain-containing protein [Anaerohalosphaera lusitana]AQT69547.1 Cytochrome c oxidase subunit 2 [Anaerohalosphaera lusitana]
MRQENVGKLAWSVVGFILMVIVLFAVVRYSGQDVVDQGEHAGHEHGSEAEQAGPQGRGSVAVNGAAENGSMELSGTVQDGVRVVEVTAKQFRFEPGRIVVKKGENVKLKITSVDVTHGFALNEFGIDVKLEPEKPVEVTLTAKEAGTYPFQCSVYCGRGHMQMDGELVVIE